MKAPRKDKKEINRPLPAGTDNFHRGNGGEVSVTRKRTKNEENGEIEERMEKTVGKGVADEDSSETKVPSSEAG